MREKFINWHPSKQSKIILEIANNILDEYDEQGYCLTLRQLYYQMVARDIILNRVEEYNKLGGVINKGRLAGYIDWNMIEDRLRKPVENSHWDSPQQILKAAANSYYLDRWKDQENYIEIWCEKDAISNIIQPVCAKWDVLFMANRGYLSQSAMYEAHKRLNLALDNQKRITVIYLGDHDPSGIDMTHDISNKLGTFFYQDKEATMGDHVNRLALNMDQIEQYSPPENPAKFTDTRYKSYVKIYGEFSWELDALEPSVLANLVENEIIKYVDTEKFKEVETLENQHKDKLSKLADEL